MLRLSIVLLFISSVVFSQTGEISDGESGLSVLTKINETIVKANNHADSIVVYRTELDAHLDSINAPYGPNGIIDGKTDYTITCTLYPGVDIPIEEETPFMCRDANFELTECFDYVSVTWPNLATSADNLRNALLDAEK